MKTIKVKCKICNVDFEKPKNEYNRRIKLGKTDFYCSLKCSGNRDGNIEMIKLSANPYHFKGGENKLITEEQKIKSSMRDFAKRVRARKSKFVYELDLNRTKVVNIDALKNVHTLNLSYTKVVDVSALKNVHTLNLSGTKVVDVSTLKNVHTLNLSDTKVVNIGALKNVHTL
ncbi:MAG: hypothetical protein RIQ51_1807, partial [Bacteroidota bacterium]